MSVQWLYKGIRASYSGAFSGDFFPACPEVLGHSPPIPLLLGSRKSIAELLVQSRPEDDDLEN